MTFERVLKEIEGRKIIRHRAICFFCVYSAEEADHFRKLGAGVTGAGGQDKEWGTPCWEVRLSGMLDPMVEVIDGEEKDVRGEFLLNYFRERDGFELAVLAR